MSQRLIRNAIVLSGLAAAAALIAGAALGQVRTGLAVSVGLLVGSFNGLLIQRSISLGVGFTALSLLRLMVMTALGLGIGLLIGLTQVWLVVVGMALAQLVLAGFAVREALAA
ncbi:MAG TPA: hypothetical protein VFR68_11480 [Candidatus Dormibacteraeota bacterium]|nr:hypothetical protein [Candidatus Dormibacteraeota bacterium]